MGMAASQARFLGLTARKNNVEFEGQQINQQRTTLSNQSANYYNDLLGMAVPVPPSVDDYTKTVYTFEDGALTNQVTAMMAQPDGTYVVSYLRQWTDDFSVVGATTSIVTDVNGDKSLFRVGAHDLRMLSDLPTAVEECTADEIANLQYMGIDGVELTKNDNQYVDADDNIYYEDDVIMYIYNGDDKSWFEASYLVEPNSASLTGYVKYVPDFTAIKNDEYLGTLSDDQLYQLMVEEEEYTNLLKQKYGDDSEYMVRYIKNTTTGEYDPYFYKLSDLEGAIYDENHHSQSNINCYKVGSETKIEEVKALPGCKIEKDSSGRYINITIPQYLDGVPLEDVPPVTYALTTTTSTDQDAYQDAMNQYEFDKAKYDQAIQEINAKIEIIQAEDKNLELRLKQLDTEQKAISTEIDAVSQVIQKNTESSFKTFG